MASRPWGGVGGLETPRGLVLDRGSNLGPWIGSVAS